MKLGIKQQSLLLIYILIILIPYGSFCDVGACARYKLNIIFNDGDSLICYIQICGYEDLKNLNEGEILQRMKVSDSVTVYKKIQTINYPEIPEGAKYYGFKYSAVANDDIIKINVNNIMKIHKLDVMRCEHGNFDDDGSYLIHYTSQVIDGLSQEDIDLLQTKPYSQITIETPGDSYDVDVCLNYNEDLDEKQLNKLCELHLENENKLPAKEFWQLQKKHYSETVKKLRSMKIIVIHLRGYC